MSALAAGRKFRRVDNHEAWLRTVALNVLRSRWRKLRNFSAIRHRIEHPTDVPAMSADHLQVVAALRELPAAQRETVALHYLADLSVRQVAQTLGVPEGTVKARLSRGRDRWQSCSPTAR